MLVLLLVHIRVKHRTPETLRSQQQVHLMMAADVMRWKTNRKRVAAVHFVHLSRSFVFRVVSHDSCLSKQTKKGRGWGKRFF